MHSHDLFTLAHTAVTSAAPEDTEVSTLLLSLASVVEVHGPVVAEAMIRLLPMALAKGDSKHSWTRCWTASSAACPPPRSSARPEQPSLPYVHRETGRLTLANLSLVSPVRT